MREVTGDDDRELKIAASVAGSIDENRMATGTHDEELHGEHREGGAGGASIEVGEAIAVDRQQDERRRRHGEVHDEEWRARVPAQEVLGARDRLRDDGVEPPPF